MEWKFIRLRLSHKKERDRAGEKSYHLEVNLMPEFKCMSRDQKLADLEIFR